jgi:alcohol dehydrogenase (NADP+)
MGPGEGVDPRSVPRRRLRTGATMPAIGFGTFGSDHVDAATVAQAVLGAARAGYRHFDCAAVYRNEAEIGVSLERIQADGSASREDLWITSKLWNDRHAPDDVLPTLRKTLEDLRLDYLDLYLIHWPFPNTHAPGVDVTARDPSSQPYRPEHYLATWRQLEQAVDLGLVRHIGTSNMTIPKLAALLRDARIPPAANEMELHPHFQQPELFEYVVSNGIQPIGYSPIGSPARPARDHTPDDSVDLEDPVIVGIAERLGVDPAAVCLKWAIARGQVPIPFSTNPAHHVANLRATQGDTLTAAEMDAMRRIDRGCRLIKGQVFLWPGARSWEDLWDPDGVIAPG